MTLRSFGGPAVATALFGLALCAAAADFSRPVEFSRTYRAGDAFMGIRHRGVVELRRAIVDELPIRELSGLAWDHDAGLLYAVSDNGHIVHLAPEFSRGYLSVVRLLGAYPLLDRDGRPLPHADAEGLDILAERNGDPRDAELIVSFQHGPRVLAFDRRGRYRRDYPVPARLADEQRHERAGNGLESVAHHPRYGVITGAEKPLAVDNAKRFSLYALGGRSWRYRPYDPEHGSLVGLEVTDDGDLLVLERNFRSMFGPIVFAVRRVRLGSDGSTSVSEVAHFNNKDGWRIDNFEALAGHRDGRYFMISDDNDSSVQRTLLVYFELLPGASLASSE